MRVAMLSWRGPQHPRRGGAEVYTERVLRGLVERGHEVTWYSARFSGERIEQWHGIRLEYGWPSLWVYASGHWWARRHAGQFDLIIDQVNSLGFCTPMTGSRVACLIHQLAADVWDAEVRWPGNKVGRLLEKAILRCYRATPFMTMCKSTVDELHERGWRGRGYVTPTGIDRTYVVDKSDVPVVSFLARFGAKAKRLDHAVAIHHDVRKSIPDCELWVIGRGEPPDWLDGLPGVKVFSDVTNDERDRLLGAAWCCVATSVREGWGRMVTESGAAGTPTVGYDVPGLRDSIIHGKTGYVVPPSVTSATEALVNLLGNSALLQQMGDAARHEAARVTWPDAIDVFETTLLAITSSNGSLLANDER